MCWDLIFENMFITCVCVFLNLFPQMREIRQWIHDGIYKVTHTIQMIQNGTIKLTLAELSGTIAGVIIVGTILLAIFNPNNHHEDHSSHHTGTGGTKRNGMKKHKKGKKKGGGGGRHHYHKSSSSSSSDGNCSTSSVKGSKIRSGHFRSDKDEFDPSSSSSLLPSLRLSASNDGERLKSSRSSSPSGRTRCESDMENTTVSAVSDSGLVATSTASTTSTITICVDEVKNKRLDRNTGASVTTTTTSSSSLLQGHDYLKNTNTTVETPIPSIKNDGHNDQSYQKKQVIKNKYESCASSDRDNKNSSKKSQSQQNKHDNSTLGSSPYSSAATNSRFSERRLQSLTNNSDRDDNISTKHNSGEKSKRGKKKRTKQNSHISTNSDEVDSLLSADMKHTNIHTPTRQTKSNRTKNYNDESCPRNHNRKVGDFECDATIGSNASYSNSGSSQVVQSPVAATSSPLSSSSPSMFDQAVIHNRRRSFTDSSALSLPQSYMTSSRSINSNNENMNVGTKSGNTMNIMETETMNFQNMEQHVNTNQDSRFVSSYNGGNNEHRLLEGSSWSPDSYRRHEFASLAHRQQMMNSRLDNHYGRFNDDIGYNENGNMMSLNGQVIRPPPGLEPSQQNSVSQLSLMSRNLSECSQQGLPYLTSSSTSSVYSNFDTTSGRNMVMNTSQACSDHFAGSLSSSMEFSQRHVTNLPPISPLNHRQAPIPIGHERVMKHNNDEEIEANLLELGGQMAGSILDF